MIYKINGDTIHSDISSGFIHMSFDDVENCIRNLSSGTPNTLFDDPFIATLKKLHDTYGAVFSLYPDLTNTTGFFNLPQKYKSDFIKCSKWLKVGFHCYEAENLENATEAEAIERYENFAGVVFDKMGGINSIDRIPRLNNISGNKNACIGLSKAESGIIGLLGASAIRNSYYLSSEQSQYLRDNGILYDTDAGLVFLNTTLCLDWFIDGYSSQTPYDVPVEDAPYDEMERRFLLPSYGKKLNCIEVYGHERNIYNQSFVINSAYEEYVKQICSFGQNYRYDFDYPQNRLGNITSLRLNQQLI